MSGMLSDKIVQALRLLLERPMCAACIASKVGVEEPQIAPLLARIHDSIHVSSSTGTCRACDTTAVVYSLGSLD